MALHVDRKDRTALVINHFFKVQFSGGFTHYQAALPASELGVRTQKNTCILPNIVIL
jgi:hypothetical protein